MIAGEESIKSKSTLISYEAYHAARRLQGKVARKVERGTTDGGFAGKSSTLDAETGPVVVPGPRNVCVFPAGSHALQPDPTQQET
jgi:hypothetical protein